MEYIAGVFEDFEDAHYNGITSSDFETPTDYWFIRSRVEISDTIDDIFDRIANEVLDAWGTKYFVRIWEDKDSIGYTSTVMG